MCKLTVAFMRSETMPAGAMQAFASSRRLQDTGLPVALQDSANAESGSVGTVTLGSPAPEAPQPLPDDRSNPKSSPAINDMVIGVLVGLVVLVLVLAAALVSMCMHRRCKRGSGITKLMVCLHL